jgi:NAD(P)-dependent dehydrogenase (short-subunit alcohol dehydrogenase family)
MPRTILITGANGNLGQDVVSVLAASGHQIFVTVGPGDVPETLLSQTVAQAQVNLLDETAAETFVKDLIKIQPQLDAAVLLVGGFAMGGMEVTNETLLDKQIALNFKTAWFVIRPLMAHFKKMGTGQFVMIGSRPAINPKEGKNVVAYAIAKSMLFSLAEIINAEGNKQGITASIIVPSTIDTPPNRKSMPDADPEKWVKAMDIGETIRYILSDTGRKLRQPVFKVYHQS